MNANESDTDGVSYRDSARLYAGRSYSDLPMEIILHIMSHLHPSDLFAASLTCQRWFEASRYPQFAERIRLDFSHCTLSDFARPISDFTNPARDYTTVSIRNVEFGAMSGQIWQQQLNAVKTLTIAQCDLREKSFKSMIIPQRRLQTLTIQNCRELFMPGRIFEQDDAAILKAFASIAELALIDNRYLSDAMLSRFVTMMPNLRAISMEANHMAFHGGLTNKFYPPHRMGTPSESVLTFHYFMKLIQPLAAQLTGLDFSATLMDGPSIESLAALDQLRLTHLSLRGCDQLSNASIITLVHQQNSIQHLDLSNVTRVTNSALIAICSALSELKSLKLRRVNISELGAKELVRLKRLEHLDLSECPCLGSPGIDNGIGSVRNERLTELHLAALDLSPLTVIRLVEQLPELRVLNLDRCRNAVTNLVVQWICKHLTRLRSLNLSGCDMISDAGLTGIDMVSTMRLFAEHPYALPPTDEPLMANEPSMLPRPISLRSRAEDDIVNDAKRKKLMMSIFEKTKDLVDPESCTGYSLDRLVGLRELRLSRCYRVTDVSLKYSFRLPELQVLSLSHCQQITALGIASLVEKCPSLESVDMAECHNILDKAVEMMAVRLKRLRRLNLEHCVALSDHTLDHLAVNCQQLRYLNVIGCRAMCSEPNMRLVSLRSLRDCAQSKPGPYLQGSVPDPPPFMC